MVFAMPHLFPGLIGNRDSRRHSGGRLDNSLRFSTSASAIAAAPSPATAAKTPLLTVSLAP
jgi:hypothetical protein